MIHIGISSRDLAKATFWQAEDRFIPGAVIEELTVAEARLLAERILHVVGVIEASEAGRTHPKSDDKLRAPQK